MFRLRDCSECGSTVESDDLHTAVMAVTHYDLSCCDGIVPTLFDLVAV